jgi:hypothetical protein
LPHDCYEAVHIYHCLISQKNPGQFREHSDYASSHFGSQIHTSTMVVVTNSFFWVKALCGWSTCSRLRGIICSGSLTDSVPIRGQNFLPFQLSSLCEGVQFAARKMKKKKSPFGVRTVH